MARFFFHFRCADRSVTDCEGVELADAGMARHEARRIAADFVDRTSGQPHPKWRSWRIEVSDARGRLVYLLPLEERAAADPTEAATPGPAPQRIVHLDMVRNTRSLAALRNHARELIRQAAILK